LPAAAEQFVYLGSTSVGRSTQEIVELAIASSVMATLSDVWQQSNFSLALATELKEYNSLVLSILLNGC